ncbi:MAG: isoquinoline 1-oxidoreductase [Bdellovibrionaceae bacterium]|nr:isoquinoline 1-oxidoreductase [Pseudobdellovibrionaceae bacterium]|tara:strand:- start:9508 stop:11706 length:2199 start_codon:yes stop_codon:yes gene_type:complete
MGMDRRDFIKSGSLIVAFSLPPGREVLANDSSDLPAHYFEIAPDGQFIFTFDKTDMGQGTATGQSTIFGEEADINPHSMILQPAGVDPRYGTMGGMQVTGGSTSTAERWSVLRQAGANTRQIMLEAAAKTWSLPLSKLSTENGHVVSVDGKKVHYSELIQEAKKISLKNPATLKSKKDFKYIGNKDLANVDALEKSTGTGAYGMDFKVPGMKVAVIERCPTFGGSVKSFNRDDVMKSPGVIDVFEVSSGIAIVCEKYWQALNARRLLKPDWNPGPNQETSSTTIADTYRNAIDKGQSNEVADLGDLKTAFSQADEIVESEYELPYLAHSPMEPMNSTAHVSKDRCEIWAPTQIPTIVRNSAADRLGFPREKVTVHVSKYLGGGFGRRSTIDYTMESVEVSQKLKQPVKVIWSREDDTKHSPMRPMSVSKFKASIKDGKVTGWEHQLGCESVMQYVIPGWVPYMTPGWIPGFLRRGLGSAAGGFMDLSGFADATWEGALSNYQIPNKSIRHIESDLSIPIHFWRSVGHSTTGYLVESFIDELAHKLNKDPFEYRRDLLPPNSRIRNCLEKVAEISEWPTPSAEGYTKGIACHSSFNSFVAQVAEVSVTSNEIEVKRVHCVVDCGTVVNPTIVEDQLKSGIIYGLSAALKGAITLKNGAIEQSNFDTYEPLRMVETPEIKVHIIDSNEPPTGVGEPGVPPIAAAVANAVYRANGQRLRKLPLKMEAGLARSESI